jgi:hypothetical protein
MLIAVKELFEAFPTYDVAIEPRPDGRLLLTLRQSDEVTLRKVIDKATVCCQKQVRCLVGDVLRDLKLASGDVAWAEDSRQWLRGDLPTFTGQPVTQTVAKTLVARRKLTQAARTAA